jgi:hypothetical protein
MKAARELADRRAREADEATRKSDEATQQILDEQRVENQKRARLAQEEADRTRGKR